MEDWRWPKTYEYQTHIFYAKTTHWQKSKCYCRRDIVTGSHSSEEFLPKDKKLIHILSGYTILLKYYVRDQEGNGKELRYDTVTIFMGLLGSFNWQR